MLIEPRTAFDLDHEPQVGVPRGVPRRYPQLLILCKVVNTTKRPHLLRRGRVVAKVVALNVRDRERLRSLLVPDSGKTLKSIVEEGETGSTSTQPLSESSETKVKYMTEPRGVDLSEANMGQLGSAQKYQLLALLSDFNEVGLFAVDPKQV